MDDERKDEVASGSQAPPLLGEPGDGSSEDAVPLAREEAEPFAGVTSTRKPRSKKPTTKAADDGPSSPPKRDGPLKYRVSLSGNPTCIVEASDPAEAFERYKASNSILATEHTPEIVEVG